MSYNVGVQCCRFCKRLMTAEAIRDHICVEEINAWEHMCHGSMAQTIWYLQHGDPRIDDDVRAFASVLISGRRCPTCGAPLDDDIDVVCPYCNFTLASPEIH